MSMEPAYPPDAGEWTCGRCGGALVPSKVEVTYLGNAFTVILPVCPACGLTMVPKTLAEGKMAEVEALLEDK